MSLFSLIAMVEAIAGPGALDHARISATAAQIRKLTNEGTCP